MLLCDQLSRNCFRGTDEAFAYDDTAVACCRALMSKRGLWTAYAPAQLTFLLTPGQHSEDLRDHEANMDVIRHLEEALGEGDPFTRTMRGFVVDHMTVVERFGRYPHRNAVLGRASTAEEEAYLADVDHLPGWAKSQLKK